MRPAGMRPAGMRPAGMRPAGMRPSDDGGGLDPEEWSADIAELFCAYSAVVRLGARLVFDIQYLPVPVTELNARYLPVPPVQDHHVPWKAGGQYLESEARDARANLGRRRSLKPNKRELVVQIAVRDSLLRGVACSPEVAMALKEDIARALVNEADAAFLHGGGHALPYGITYPGNGQVPTGDLLADARVMIAGLRNGPRVRFDNPGWVIDVRTLDTLTKLQTNDYLTGGVRGRKTLDSTRLLMLDGDDSGVLLGYPFVATAAAREGDKSRMYFSADWSEAWIGVDQDLVTVAISTETEFKTDQTLLRAVMHHDFAVRTPNLFAYTDLF
jgi:hypothetical protein